MSSVKYEVDGALAPVSMNDTPPQPGRVGIIGANATGVGIAMRLLDADIPVTLFEPEREALDQGMAVARKAYQDLVSKEGLTAARRDRCLALLAGAVNFHHLKDCDLIIEAAPAAIGEKEKLFRRLDEVAKPGAILVSCAAQADVDHLARFTRRPAEVLGLQLMSSATAGGEWEPVPGKETSGETIETVIALGRKTGRGAAASMVEAQVGH